MDPKKIAIADYSYTLPDEKIASYPLQERDASKLLIYKNGKISTDIYRNIATHIPSDSLLIFNNTKVIEARLLFQKPTGGTIEIFCLEPHQEFPDTLSAMQKTKTAEWKCLIGGASKWKAGQILEKKIIKNDEEIILYAKFISKQNNHFIIQLSWLPENMIFAEVLHAAGAIPLPPYIKRAAEKQDAERYQTVYAYHDGSVAAPTAGLHFTQNIFQQLAAKNIEHEFVTLHVGAGTFKPVNAEIIEHHEMHSEYIQVSKSGLQHLLNACDKNIIAVGTTSLRTIETLYWLGVKTIIDPDINIHDLQLGQWEAYEINKKNIDVKEALQSLINRMALQQVDVLFTKTQMIITPGYEIKMAKALVTNFHQPQSTLLLLVAAMAGDDWKKIYKYALQNDFRFLSYGDGSLIWLNS